MFELLLVILAAVGVFLMYNALSAFGGPALQPPAKPKATNVKGAGVAKKKAPTKAELAAQAKQKQRDEEFIAREVAGANKGLNSDTSMGRPVSLDEHKSKLAAKREAEKPSSANTVVDTEKARNQAKAQGFKLVEEEEQEVSNSKKQRMKKIADAQAAYNGEAESRRSRPNRNRENGDREERERQEDTPEWQIMTRKELLDRKMSKFFKGGRKGGDRGAPHGADRGAQDEQSVEKKKVGAKAVTHTTFDAKKTWNSGGVTSRLAPPL